MELTEMVKNHKMKYDGSWDKMRCTRCRKTFTIGADMCDSDGIVKELKRIGRIKCRK